MLGGGEAAATAKCLHNNRGTHRQSKRRGVCVCVCVCAEKTRTGEEGKSTGGNQSQTLMKQQHRGDKRGKEREGRRGREREAKRTRIQTTEDKRAVLLVWGHASDELQKRAQK